MRTLLHTLTLLYGVVALAQSAYGGCTINSDGKTGSSQVLLWNQKGDIVYPESSRTVDIAAGDTVTLSCQGSDKAPSFVDNSAIPGLPKDSATVELSCSADDDKFHFGSSEGDVKVESVSCTGTQVPTIDKEKWGCSSRGADGRTSYLEELYSVEIGWTGTQNLTEQIDLCIDDEIGGTIWATYKIHGKSINQRDTTSVRPAFKTDIEGEDRFLSKCSSSAIDKAYTKEEQVKRITKLLGENRLAESTTPIINVSDGSSFYLVPGQLAPEDSSIYNVEQDATYFYINSAPQFKSFNDGNWKAIGDVARSYAAKQQEDIAIYSGVHGVLQYPHMKNKMMIDIYLISCEEQFEYLPVPKYFWTLIHDPTKNEALFVIGLNNPYAQKFEDDFCKSVCDSIKGLSQYYADPAKGLLQCCQMSEDLSKKIPDLPYLKDDNNEYPKLISGLKHEK